MATTTAFPDKCERHKSEELRFYCSTCREAACRDCIAFDRKHYSPPCDYKQIKDVATGCREGLRSLTRQLDDKKAELFREGNEGAEELLARLREGRAKYEAEISGFYDELIGELEGRKQKAIREMREGSDSVITELQALQKEARDLLSQIQHIQESVEGLSDKELFARREPLTLEAENVELKAGLPVFGTGAASYGMVSVESVLAKLGSDLPEYAQVDRKQCIVHVKKEVQVNTTVHVYITLCDSAGFPCSVEQKVLVNVVSCSGTGDSLTTDVTLLSLSRYMACFTPTPSTRGRRKVTVEVNGERIDDDLISVLVQCSPQLLHRQTPKTIDNIWHMGCIKSIGDRVICLTRAEAVVATLKSGEPQVVYIDGQVVTLAYKLKLPLHCQWAPDEIAVGNNSLYVNDIHNNKVHRINLSDGTYIGSTGSKGCGEGQFNHPNGLCFAQDNHLYVCDSDNHRIQVFDQDLKFCRTFGEMGTDSGCFLWPSNVASTSTKDGKVLLYVSEVYNHRVQCVTAAGVHVRFIGSWTGESRLRRPNILHTHSSYLFVSDDRGVIVFTTSGEFVTRFATELYKVGDYPIEGLTVSSDGFVYVYHCPQNRIFLY